MPRPYVGQLMRRPRWTPGPSAQIDWSHPLAQGLVACVLPGVGPGNLATGGTCGVTSNGNITRKTSGYGAHAYGTWDNSNYLTVKEAPIVGNLANWTIAAGITSTTGTTASRSVYCERASSGNDILKLDTNPPSQASRFGFVYRDDGGSLTGTYDSNHVIDDGYLHDLMITRSGGSFAGYYDGGAGFSSAGYGGTTNFTDAGVSRRIGHDKTGFGFGTAGVSYIYVWANRTLVQANAAAIRADPFQMVVELSPTSFFFLGDTAATVTATRAPARALVLNRHG